MYLQVEESVGRIFPELGRYGKVEMKIETNEIVWPALSPSPPIGRNEKRFFRIVTKQEHPYMMYRPPDEDRLCGHHEVPCAVNGYNLPGNSTENGTLACCCTGLGVEVLGILAERMNFEYDLFDVPDGQWGVEIFRKTTAEETSQNIAHSTSVDSPDSPVDSGDDANREGACGDGDDTASVGDEESTGDDDDTSTEDSESKSDDTVSVATTTGGHSFVPYWQGQVGVVRGCLTQFTIKSRYQGNQCTSMSYTALCWAFVIPIDTWTSAIIDDILRAGNNMHNEFRDTLLLSTEADGRISIDDVPLAFSVDVCGVPCISNRGEVTHTFSSLSPEIAGFAKEAGLLSIQDFIESESRHVNESMGFLVTVMAYTYMIFRTSDDRWHVFDSHGCLRYAVDEVIGSQQATVATFTTAGGVMAPLIEKHGHGAQSCCTRICVEEVQTPDSIPSPKTPTPCSSRPASPSSWSSWEMIEAGDVSVQDVVVQVPDDVDDDDDHASVLMRMASGIAIRTEPLVSCSMAKAREPHDKSGPDVSPVVKA